jgi:hypothetical protein
MAFNFYRDASFKKNFNEMSESEKKLAINEIHKFINDVFSSDLSDDMIAYMGENMARAKRGQKPSNHQAEPEKVTDIFAEPKSIFDL